MQHLNNPQPTALDNFLQNLETGAQAAGHPAGVMLSMKHDPAMLDILARMVGAELKSIKEKRQKPGCGLCAANSEAS